MDGRIPLEEINELLGTNIPTEGADTLGGLIFNRIGRVPTKGETVLEDNVSLTVEALKERRIHKVRVKIEPPDETNSQENEQKG